MKSPSLNRLALKHFNVTPVLPYNSTGSRQEPQNKLREILFPTCLDTVSVCHAFSLGDGKLGPVNYAPTVLCQHRRQRICSCHLILRDFTPVKDKNHTTLGKRMPIAAVRFETSHHIFLFRESRVVWYIARAELLLKGILEL